MQNLPNDISMEKLMLLAKSPAGQQLIALLKSKDSGQLQQAVKQASSGDYTLAKESISSLLASEDIQKIIDQLGG